MSFASSIVKSYATGAQTAFTAVANVIPASMNGSQIALNTKTAGSIVSTAGLVLPVGGSFNIEWDSLCAIVQTNLTTSTITAQTLWQVSEDGTNWMNLLGLNSAANVTVAAAGTGSLVTTTYVQAAPGINPPFPYMRLAVLVGVVTGGAGDNVVVSYQFRKRFIPIG